MTTACEMSSTITHIAVIVTGCTSFRVIDYDGSQNLLLHSKCSRVRLPNVTDKCTVKCEKN